MAHPYTTRERLTVLVRPSRLANLLDVDQDGGEDAGVLVDIIERACNQVDADLARYYVVPFTATPSTPGIVADLTDYAACVLLFELGGAPASEDAKNFQRRYDALLERIRSGTATIPGASGVAAEDGVVAISYYAVAPVAAGVDSSGNLRREFIG